MIIARYNKCGRKGEIISTGEVRPLRKFEQTIAVASAAYSLDVYISVLPKSPLPVVC
jgi:hypothetical protein